ncbi:PTS mannose/fructose/sorbose transporter subunit IIC [Anaerococcus sp. Marseille-P9784]|uniref:PTS mannose/fructose/sorbose transporter subunit IIC n=1 Tax=Anaerococcus sp. Marseille-P9784 TaxID=2614127 RepID=UPI00124A9B65|nr:PTS mannose/fructose/sorbose transporter subunit IIC [Anaerococcus sp. Marseille-P9784]
MNILNIILIFVVAFLAGCEGILDQFQFHQPLVACTLIGLVTGHLKEGVMLGGSLQLLALGWANIGAAVAPDAALASVASAIIMALALSGGSTNVTEAISTAIALAIPLSVAGLFLTMLARTFAIPMVHAMDVAAEDADFAKIERIHWAGVAMQGLRIAIPALILCFIPAEVVTNTLKAMPEWLKGGMQVGGGMVAAVGYAMVLNMMSTKETWPFFALGFVIAAIPQITLIGLGIIGVAFALIYMKLKGLALNSGSQNAASGDPLGDIINDY